MNELWTRPFQDAPRCVERRRESIHLGVQVRRFLAYCDGMNSPAAVLQAWYLRFPQTDKLVYYYRPTPKDTPCSDDIGRPNGWQYDDDLVFVIAMLVSPGTVTIAFVHSIHCPLIYGSLFSHF
jgi:hypothetical protein